MQVAECKSCDSDDFIDFVEKLERCTLFCINDSGDDVVLLFVVVLVLVGELLCSEGDNVTDWTSSPDNCVTDVTCCVGVVLLRPPMSVEVVVGACAGDFDDNEGTCTVPEPSETARPSN